jgi:hypothetical protein
MADAMISTEIGGGQYWHQMRPQNLMELADAHGPIPPELKPLIESGRATPILVVQGCMLGGKLPARSAQGDRPQAARAVAAG